MKTIGLHSLSYALNLTFSAIVDAIWNYENKHIYFKEMLCI